MDESTITSQPLPGDRSITPPLLVWLLVQLIALGIAAARVPLAANFIQPGEALAIDEMLVVQFLASAMLFPFLLRDVRCCLTLMLTAGPMLQLAGMLSGTPLGRIAAVWTCFALWLAALTIWKRMIPIRARGIAIAFANLLTIGGLILWYLAAELGSDPKWIRAFPLVGGIRIVHGNDIFLPLISTSLFAGIAAIYSAILQFRSHRARIDSPEP